MLKLNSPLHGSQCGFFPSRAPNTTSQLATTATTLHTTTKLLCTHGPTNARTAKRTTMNTLGTITTWAKVTRPIKVKAGPSGTGTTTTATTTASTMRPITMQPATAATAVLAATTTPTVLVTTALTHAAATIHVSPVATLNILRTTTMFINGIVLLAVLPARRALSTIAVMRSPYLRVPCNAQARANPHVLEAAPITLAGRVADPRCATESAAAAQQLCKPCYKHGVNACNSIAQSG